MKTEKEIKELINKYEERQLNEVSTLSEKEHDLLVSWIYALNWVLETD